MRILTVSKFSYEFVLQENVYWLTVLIDKIIYIHIYIYIYLATGDVL